MAFKSALGLAAVNHQVSRFLRISISAENFSDKVFILDFLTAKLHPKPTKQNET
jgi:hypothetical protein